MDTDSRPPGATPWPAFACVATGVYMATLDSSIVNVALPAILNDFHTSLATVEWVTNIYLVVITGLLLACGRLADLLGHRSVFAAGLTLFTLGSGLCALAASPVQLIATRALQGSGAAMLMACAPAIITAVFPSDQRGRGLGFVGTTVAVGLTSGPALGGLLLEWGGWRTIFLVNLPVGVLGLVLTLRILPPLRFGGRPTGYDLTGAALFTAGCSGGVLALNRMRQWGPTSPLSWTVLLLAGVVLAGFVAWERQAPAPLVDLALFRRRSFSAAVLASLFSYLAAFVAVLLLPFHLLQARGMSPGSAGLLLMIPPLVMSLVAPWAGGASDRLGYRRLTTWGLLLRTAAFTVFCSVGATSPKAWLILGMVLLGGGGALFNPPNTSSIMGSVPSGQLGAAGGITAVARNLGMALGVATGGAIFASAFHAAGGRELTSLGPGQLAAFDWGWRAAMAAGLAACLLALLCSSLRGLAGGGKDVTSPVVLVHPPLAVPSEPSPGLLVLAGFLRRHGLSVQLVDANLAVHEALLAGEPPHAAATPGPTHPAAATRRRRAARAGPRALTALRRPATYEDPNRYRAAVDAAVETYRVRGRERGLHLGVGDLVHPCLAPHRSADLAAVARDPERLPLASELDGVAQCILEQDPGLVGLSACYLSQVLAAFCLAGLLRRAGYRGRLVLGGGVITSWARGLQPALPVFETFDALVAGPGEAALLALARGDALAPHGNVFAPRLGHWGSGAGAPAVCFEPELAGGLPWEDYLAPGPILPLATCRGCYWRRCAFCPETAQDRQRFRRGPSGELAATLRSARRSPGCRWVHLTDDAVPPATLRSLARELQDTDIHWYGFVRLERQLLDAAFARNLYAGGCRMLQLGVESASQRLLDRMGKGVRAEHAAPILANLRAAGIRTYVYMLFGIPGETRDEARASLEWLERHAGCIDFLNLALMNLPRRGPLAQAPATFGVVPEGLQGPADDLSLYLPYQDTAGTDRRDLRRLLGAARRHPAIRPILARVPPGFTSNHAAFAPLPPAPGPTAPQADTQRASATGRP